MQFICLMYCFCKNMAFLFWADPLNDDSIPIPCENEFVSGNVCRGICSTDRDDECGGDYAIDGERSGVGCLDRSIGADEGTSELAAARAGYVVFAFQCALGGALEQRRQIYGLIHFQITHPSYLTKQQQVQ